MNGSISIDGTPRNKKPFLVDDCNEVVNINDLPEYLLTHIISLMPMKDAVRTSVLSKDWEYKWTSLTNINFDDSQIISYSIYKRANFLIFVDRALLLCRNLKSFRLSCKHAYGRHFIKTWISALSRQGCQSIEIVSYAKFILPPCLFYNTSLTILKLNLICTIKVPFGNYFSNLTFLSLCKVILKNEHSSDPSRFTLTFPVLESLKLSSCTWVNAKFVEINSPALTSFQYDFCRGNEQDHYLIKVCRARLDTFETDGCPLDIFDLNASLIVNASIYCHYEHPFIGTGGLSLKDFSGLKHLSLRGTSIMKAYAQLKPGLCLPCFYKLESLKLSEMHWGSEALLELLHTMPNLKLLILRLPFNFRAYDAEDYNYEYDDVGAVPSCISRYLEKVKLYNFAGSVSQVLLTKFLLKNSMKLEEVFVSVHSNPLITKVKVKNMLSTFPKGSSVISFVIAEDVRKLSN